MMSSEETIMYNILCPRLRCIFYLPDDSVRYGNLPSHFQLPPILDTQLMHALLYWTEHVISLPNIYNVHLSITGALLLLRPPISFSSDDGIYPGHGTSTYPICSFFIELARVSISPDCPSRTR